MYQKVKAYVKKHRMLEEQHKVIVGVSGGADSICLLFMLIELQKEMNLELVAVHIHHGLRGENADADEAFVRKICQEHGVECLVFREDVRNYAREHHLTEEEAGRIVRRNIFDKVLKEQNANRIALAHHENDNAETVIWHLCRGTGLKGIGGIRPVKGEYIRPLLSVSRAEIESYLQKREVSYCVDETNMENHYTRNRIRNQLIPYLEENINGQTVKHIADFASQMAEMSDYIQKEAERYLEECTEFDDNGSGILKKQLFERVPDALKKYVLRMFICAVSGEEKDIEAVHVEVILELLEKQVGKRSDLPYDLEALRVYEGICLRKKEEKLEGNSELNVKFREFMKCECEGAFPEKKYTKWFDCDIIKNTVEIRHRMPGDYIVINKEGKTQKLKQYFINEKIPQEQRDKVWLAADGQEIMWIIGYRQSQAYQVTDKTMRIMEIDICKGGK